MHVDPLGPGKFHVAFLDATEFVRAYTEEIMRGSLFLPGEGFPAKGAACAAVLLFPVNNDRVELSGQVERVSAEPPKGAHLKLSSLPDEIRKGIELFLTEILRGETPPIRFSGAADRDSSDLDPSLLSDADADAEGDEALRSQEEASGAAHKGKALYAQIKDMPVQKKIKLALVGGKAARAALIKDPQQVVHQYVLKNARITADEISEISKNPASSVEVIRLISVNSQWMGDLAIRWNVIRNPKTNTQLAVSLVSKLPVTQLNQLAKSDSVKGAVSQAAFKLLEAKGKRS